jgi:hypothetical protein
MAFSKKLGDTVEDAFWTPRRSNEIILKLSFTGSAKYSNVGAGVGVTSSFFSSPNWCSKEGGCPSRIE